MIAKLPLPTQMLLAAAFALVTSSCQNTRDPEFVPITEQDEAELEAKHDAPTNQGRFRDIGTLFITLDQNLRTWRELILSADSNRKLELGSLEEAVTRLVYNNFDTILEALVNGDHDHKVTAAAALGFSRIPAPDEVGGDPEFLPVHDRAVGPLVDVLDDGNDGLTQNALLSLSRIASRETPLDLMQEILVSHHDPDVRSNAALALSHILQPEDTTIAIGALYAALEDDESKVRLHVVSALARLDDPSCQGQVLGVFTHDKSPLVRANAARILGHIGTPEAVPYLANGLIDKTAIVRLASYRSLCRITGENLGKTQREWMEWFAQQSAKR